MMMIKQWAILFLLAGSVQVVQAQFVIRSIALNKGPGTGWLAYRFPIVHGKNTVAARNINRILQQKILENNEIIVDSNKIFEKSRYINNDTFNQSGYSEIDFTVVVNNSRVLSLQFDMESTGAYSSNFPLYYSFDSKTGNQIFFDALFKPNARSILKQRLLKERKKRIVQFIKEQYTDSEDSLFIKESYQECLSEDDVANIYITSQSIVFYKEYCFPHVVRPYDTDLDVEISIKELSPLLTDYAKKVFAKQ